MEASENAGDDKSKSDIRSQLEIENEKEAKEKKGKKSRKKKKKRKEIDPIAAGAKDDVKITLFSELYKLLDMANGLPYPMKDPEEILNIKERQATEKVLSESLQDLFPLHSNIFYASDSPEKKAFTEKLLKDYIDPKVFIEFFEGDWDVVLNEFFGRDLNPDTDIDIAQKFISEIIRLSIPIEEYINRHISIRKEEVKGDWDEKLLKGKWFKRALAGERSVRESLLNRLMVICPQFFNDDILPDEPPEFLLSSGAWTGIRNQGGLHIIGTERHESRRIDNQLRGRTGRQGDPGSSQFFLSLEDDLLRILAGDRSKKIKFDCRKSTAQSRSKKL